MTNVQNSLFASAWVKARRAEKHIENLEVALTTFLKNAPCNITSKIDPKTGNRLVYATNVQSVPVEIVTILEDVVQCLRSALDRAAFSLWEANGRAGNNPSRPSFPIFNSAEEYLSKSSGRRKLFGVRVSNAFDAIKPYKSDYAVLWSLNELNNITKHRHIATTVFAGSFIDMSRAFSRMAGISFPENSPPFATTEMRELGNNKPLKEGAIIDSLSPPFDAFETYNDLKFYFHVAIAEADIPLSLPVQKLCLKFHGAVQYILHELEKLAT